MWIFRAGKNKNELNDAELIASYKKTGDRQVIEILFERYTHLVFGVCMKYLKDEEESRDAVLVIFENLLEDLRKFEIKSFSSWIHAVARNYCLMHLRKQKSLFRQHNEYELDVTSANVYSQDNTEEEQLENMLNHLRTAIQELSEEQRACVELFYLHGKCYNDVADLTGFTLNQVKSFIQNGKRNLKLMLIKHHEKRSL
ncbi:MAG: RNA polymerase sigma factor [Bacteroidia bacterium]